VGSPVQCCLAVLDGGTFVVGERDGREHPLQVVLGFEKLCLTQVFQV
jgi:hypothetical protein